MNAQILGRYFQPPSIPEPIGQGDGLGNRVKVSCSSLSNVSQSLVFKLLVIYVPIEKA